MNKYKLVKNTEWKEVEVNGETEEIPNDWEVGCLTNICEIKGGISAPKDFIKQEKDKTLPFFRVSNLSTRKKFLTAKETKEFLPLGKYKSFPKDSILIAKSGESIRQKYRSFLTEESIIVGHIAILLAKYNKDYLYNLLMYFSPEDTLLKDSTMPALSTTELGKFQIYYPPISQQSAIADILSNQESIIQNIESLISKYESRFQYLSEELLSGRLRVKEVDGQLTLYKNADDNWKEVEINGEIKQIPQDWEVSRISEIADFKNGYAFKKEDISELKTSNKILKIGNISLNKTYINESNNQTYLNNINSNFELFNNDLIIAMDDLTPDVCFIGTTTIIKNEVGRLFQNQRLGSIHPRRINKKYLNFQINNNQYIFGKIATGSTAKNLSKGMIENFEVRVARENEQSKIDVILSQQEDLINQQKQLLTKEKQKFDCLLDNLLSGKYLIKESNMDFKIANTIEEQNEWFKECQKKQIYYIYITERDKYAKINWDHISLNLSIEQELDEIHQPEREKLDGLIDLFMRHMNPRDKDNHKLPATYNGSTLVGYFDNIPKEKAHELAQDLANYLNGIVKNYINQPKI